MNWLQRFFSGHGLLDNVPVDSWDQRITKRNAYQHNQAKVDSAKEDWQKRVDTAAAIKQKLTPLAHNVWRCNCCDVLKLTDGHHVPNGLRLGDDPEIILEFLERRGTISGTGWCAPCVAKLTMGYT